MGRNDKWWIVVNLSYDTIHHSYLSYVSIMTHNTHRSHVTCHQPVNDSSASANKNSFIKNHQFNRDSSWSSSVYFVCFFINIQHTTYNVNISTLMLYYNKQIYIYISYQHIDINVILQRKNIITSGNTRRWLEKK